jgi:hypothetical protein
MEIRTEYIRDYDGVLIEWQNYYFWSLLTLLKQFVTMVKSLAEIRL